MLKVHANMRGVIWLAGCNMEVQDGLVHMSADMHMNLRRFHI